jgi:hypothetical protein
MSLHNFVAWVRIDHFSAWVGFTKKSLEPFQDLEMELYGENFKIEYDGWQKLPPHKKMIWLHISFAQEQECDSDINEEIDGKFIGTIQLALDDNHMRVSRKEPGKIAKVWVNIRLPMSMFPIVASMKDQSIKVQTAHVSKEGFYNHEGLDDVVALVRAIEFWSSSNK